MQSLFTSLFRCPECGVPLKVVSVKYRKIKYFKNKYDKIVIKQCPKCGYKVKIQYLIIGGGSCGDN